MVGFAYAIANQTQHRMEAGVFKHGLMIRPNPTRPGSFDPTLRKMQHRRTSRPIVCRAYKAPATEKTAIEKQIRALVPMLDIWEQQLKENRRRALGKEFQSKDWRRHRSMTRGLRHVSSMPKSSTVLSLLAPCCFTAGLAALAASTGTAFLDSLHLTSSETFDLTGPPLGLLLVFRTNESSERWKRANNVWNEVQYVSLDLATATLATLAHDHHRRDLVLRYVAAYVCCLQAQCWPERSAEQLADSLREQAGLEEDEVARLVHARNRTGHTLQVLSTAIAAAGEVPSSMGCRQSDHLLKLAEAAGVCDMLMRIPIPLSYTRQTSRFLMLWLCFLPFPLADKLSYTAAPAMFFISFVLLGIEEIGVQIEEPLSVMDLDSIVTRIVADIDDARDSHETIQEYTRVQEAEEVEAGQCHN